MHRFLPICMAGVWLAGFAFGAKGQEPAPSDTVMAPRTDLTTRYSDAYFNPQAVAPYSETVGQSMGGLWRNPRRNKIIFSTDVLHYWRSKPNNVELVRVSENIFDREPGVNGPELNADFGNTPPDTITLYGFPLGGPITSPSGLIEPATVNDPGINGVFDVNGTFVGNFPTFLLPNDPRIETDDFDTPGRMGFRPKLGIELPSGSRIEFSYFFIKDFEGGTLIDDVSGSAILTKYPSHLQVPFFVTFFRWGYLTSDFTTAVPDFGGERRRQTGMDPSLIPHDPQNENPSVPALLPTPAAPVTGFSRDIPREPTVNDNDRLATVGAGGTQDVENQPFPSLLWEDGEMAIASYSFDLQGGLLEYTRPMRQWRPGNWTVEFTGGVRYLSMNEQFNFFFADIAGFDTPVPAFSPFDRFIANPLAALFDRPQPSNQTYATIDIGFESDLVGPEVGLNAKLPFWGIFQVDLMGKAGFMANFMEKTQSVIRGDGLAYYVNISKEVQSTSGIFEGQFGLSVYPMQNVRIRGGAEFMWLLSVGTAIGNLSYNLDQLQRPHNNENILFSGYYFGAEVAF